MSGVGLIIKKNNRYLQTFIKPLFKMLCMRLILFYQKYLSKKTCMFKPTCSQYTMESINNYGVILGILMGFLRILRCTPFVKGGTYDPVPENPFKVKWLV